MGRSDDEWICKDCRKAFNAAVPPAAYQTFWDGEAVRAALVCSTCLYRPDLSEAMGRVEAEFLVALTNTTT
jgi:transposase-like protein